MGKYYTHNNMLYLKTLRLIIIVCPREECCSFWTWLSKCSVIILKTRFFQLTCCKKAEVDHWEVCTGSKESSKELSVFTFRKMLARCKMLAVVRAVTHHFSECVYACHSTRPVHTFQWSNTFSCLLGKLFFSNVLFEWYINEKIERMSLAI